VRGTSGRAIIIKRESDLLNVDEVPWINRFRRTLSGSVVFKVISPTQIRQRFPRREISQQACR
jgi:hypothetical protein